MKVLAKFSIIFNTTVACVITEVVVPVSDTYQEGVNQKLCPLESPPSIP